jgi:hypothetical protein
MHMHCVQPIHQAAIRSNESHAVRAFSASSDGRPCCSLMDLAPEGQAGTAPGRRGAGSSVDAGGSDAAAQAAAAAGVHASSGAAQAAAAAGSDAGSDAAQAAAAQAICRTLRGRPECWKPPWSPGRLRRTPARQLS